MLNTLLSHFRKGYSRCVGVQVVPEIAATQLRGLPARAALPSARPSALAPSARRGSSPANARLCTSRRTAEIGSVCGIWGV